MNSLKHFLKTIGLNTKESNIYMTLLETGSQATSVIAKRIGLPRSSASFNLEGLVQKGFVKKELRANAQYFSAIAPEELEAILKRQKNKIETQIEELELLLPDLKKLAPVFSQGSKVSYYEGVEGLCKMIDLLAKADTTLYFISAHDFHPEVYKYIQNVYVPKREELQHKSQMIVVLNDQSENYSRYAEKIYEWIGFVDGKKIEFESTIVIYDNKIQLLSGKTDDLKGILIENQYLAKTMKSVFDLIKLSSWLKKD